MKEEQPRQSKEKQQRKSDKALLFLEDRLQLLDTIREMINTELDRREQERKSDPPPDDRPKRTLWRRIVDLFT